MTAYPYCACRTAALRIFVRSLVGRTPSSVLTATSTSASALTKARAFATSSPAVLSTQWRTDLHLGARLGHATALRAIHDSRRFAAQASEHVGSRDAAEAMTADEPTDKQGQTIQTPKPPGTPTTEDTTQVAAIPENADADADTPPPAPTTPGKNRRKKLRRRLAAEAQAVMLLEGLEAQAAPHAPKHTSPHPPAADAADAAAAAQPGKAVTTGDAPSPTPKSGKVVSDSRKERKVLRAARRAELKKAALKEELADQIMSRKQRQARQKAKAAKHPEKESDAESVKAAESEQLSLQERTRRRMEKKLRGKAERLALLAKNDPAKYAEVEAGRVKKEMKKERRAERLEKKRLREEKSRLMRTAKKTSSSKHGKDKDGGSDDKDKEKRELEAWQAQKKALKEKFPEGWKPRKKLSPDALDGIRALHKQFPETYTTTVLSAHFEVSPEAIRRILKSKWQAKPEEDEDRQMRWFERGKQVWTRWAALGKKPPKQWRREGILRDASWTGSRKRALEAREAHEGRPARAATSRDGQASTGGKSGQGWQKRGGGGGEHSSGHRRSEGGGGRGGDRDNRSQGRVRGGGAGGRAEGRAEGSAGGRAGGGRENRGPEKGEAKGPYDW